VVDYAKLADKAKANQDVARGVSASRTDGETRLIDPGVFYGNVKAHLADEINKANPELAKRGVPTLDRSFLPSFSGKFCFTFGFSLLCTVELDAQQERNRIKALISGPPNGNEIGRREYLFNRPVSEQQSFRSEEGIGVIVTGLKPAEIAVDIVSSILSGEFS
jgi:hypothetical protein